MNTLLYFHILLISSVLTAQTSFSERLTRTQNNIFHGLSESMEWYDIPIGFAYLSNNSVNIEHDDRIQLPATQFEMKMQSNIGVNNRFSIGSMDKNTLPIAIQLSRGLYIVGKDLFTEEGATPDCYKHAILFQKAMIYNYVFTELIKNITFRERPDKSDGKSFFSGHTSAAFTTATFLYREADDFFDEWEVTSNNTLLRKTLKYTSFSFLYGWAGYVGYSRMRDNKHYFVDVITGACAGTIISTLIYDFYLNEENKDFTVNLNFYKDVPSLSFQFHL